MKFTLLERIVLGTIMPTEGRSFTDLIIIDGLKEKIGISTEELVEYEIKAEGNQTKWNSKGATSEFDIEILEIETALIKGILTKLNDDEKGDINTLSLYKKFN